MWHLRQIPCTYILIFIYVFFLQGCAENLEAWYKEQYVIFLIAGLIIVLIEFMVLLSTILACTKLYKFKRHAKEQKETKVATNVQSTNENFYHRKVPFNADNAYAMSNSFRQNYKLIDRAWWWIKNSRERSRNSYTSNLNSVEIQSILW